MKFATIRAIVLIAMACWCSYSFFGVAMRRGSSLRWYRRAIFFLGAILMAGVAIGGLLLVAGKLNPK
jgi:hypothetical protein